MRAGNQSKSGSQITSSPPNPPTCRLKELGKKLGYTARGRLRDINKLTLPMVFVVLCRRRSESLKKIKLAGKLFSWAYSNASHYLTQRCSSMTDLICKVRSAL